jgi:hypothetical protein
VAAVIVAAVAAAVATGFRTARFAPASEGLSKQRTRGEGGKSDQSNEIFLHVYCLLFNALGS